MRHPNFEKTSVSAGATANNMNVEPLLADEDRTQKKVKPYKVGCARYLQRFDEAIMKPIFIHKYHRQKAQDDVDFYNVMVEDGNHLEAMYKRQKTGDALG